MVRLWLGLSNQANIDTQKNTAFKRLTTIAPELQPYLLNDPSHGGIHRFAFAALRTPPRGASHLRVRRDRNSLGPRGSPTQRNRAGVKPESTVGSLSTEPLFWSQTADPGELLERVAVGQRRRLQVIPS